MYLRYDYEVDKRPKKDDQISYFNKLLRSNGIIYSKNDERKGAYGESNRYNFITNNYGIKFIRFNDKDTKKMIHTAKAWSFTAAEMKETGLNTIFIYDIEQNDINDEVIPLIDILKKNAKVIHYTESLAFLEKIDL